MPRSTLACDWSRGSSSTTSLAGHPAARSFTTCRRVLGLDHRTGFPAGESPMTGVDVLAWFVLAFADGPDCLLQASVHRLPEGPAWVREDGCAVHSQQEGSHVVLWSSSRWVAIKLPAGARSLSYRWGSLAAFVNGKRVTIQHGTIGRGSNANPSWRHEHPSGPLDDRRISASLLPQDQPSVVTRPTGLVQSTPGLRIESARDARAL